MESLDELVYGVWKDKIINKGFVNKFKEKLNLPVYIIENLINHYSDNNIRQDSDTINQRIQQKLVKAKGNLKVQSQIKERGSIIIIDKVIANINSGKDEYQAHLLNLGTKDVKISNKIINDYPKLLENGLWAELKIIYLDSSDGKESGFEIKEINPFQKNVNLEEFKEKRNQFNDVQWLSLLLRSIGIEPSNLSQRERLLTLARLIPFVEKNYNFIELGLRGTGKSYVYRQLSSESILVSGGKTTVANLFYNMGTKEIGLLGKWDVVAFDEVAYIDFKDKTAIQILKDYMEAGSFSRGKEEINAEASLVFLGNINQNIVVLLNKSHLFKPLPLLMQDIALVDRFHFYLPGWEMRKLKDEDITSHYGLRISYLALILDKLRNLDFTDKIDYYYSFDQKMDVRDRRAVKKTVSGYLKLLHPTGDFTQENIKTYLDMALEGRKRVKEQLIKMAPFEYEQTSFEYIDLRTNERYCPQLPELSMENKFKRSFAKPGTVYIGQILEEKDLALLKVEIKMEAGSGKLIFIGEADYKLKKQIRKAFIFIKNKRLQLKLREKAEQNNFYVKLTSIKHQIDADISSAFLIAMYSLLNHKSVSSGLLVTEESSLYRKVKSNKMIKALKVEKENGGIKTLLPLKSGELFVEVPSEIIAQVPYFITV